MKLLVYKFYIIRDLFKLKEKILDIYTSHTPHTPHKGKGFSGVSIVIPLPLPLPLLTPALYPWGFPYLCYSLDLFKSTTSFPSDITLILLPAHFGSLCAGSTASASNCHMAFSSCYSLCTTQPPYLILNTGSGPTQEARLIYVERLLPVLFQYGLGP